MQVRAVRVAGVAELAQHLPGLDAVAGLHGHAARDQVRVAGVGVLLQLQDHYVAVGLRGTDRGEGAGRLVGDPVDRRHHLAVADRQHRRAVARVAGEGRRIAEFRPELIVDRFQSIANRCAFRNWPFTGCSARPVDADDRRPARSGERRVDPHRRSLVHTRGAADGDAVRGHRQRTGIDGDRDRVLDPLRDLRAVRHREVENAVAAELAGIVVSCIGRRADRRDRGEQRVAGELGERAAGTAPDDEPGDRGVDGEAVDELDLVLDVDPVVDPLVPAGRRERPHDHGRVGLRRQCPR